MRNVQKLVEAHLSVWAINDPEERAAAITRVYAQNVAIVEPDGVVHGREALNSRIGQLQEHFSGLSFSVTGAIHHHHDHAMYEWDQPLVTQAGSVTGWDVLHFDGDLIDHAVMFIPGFDELAVPPSGHGDGPA